MFSKLVSFAQAVNDDELSVCDIVFRDSSLDQSPALCEGVPELPPFPMKCTVLPEFLVFSTNFQNYSNCSTGNSEIVEIMSLK